MKRKQGVKVVVGAVTFGAVMVAFAGAPSRTDSQQDLMGPAELAVASAASNRTLASIGRQPVGATVAVATPPAQERILDSFAQTAGGPLSQTRSTRTGHLEFLQAPAGAVLVKDGPGAPAQRALHFVGSFGSVLGLSAAEQAAVLAGVPAKDGSSLRVLREETDSLGETHVRLVQEYQGLPVLGGELVVHLDEQGVRGVNGQFVPGINLDPQPSLTSAQAEALALADLQARHAGEQFTVTSAQLGVYRRGLLEGTEGPSVLAYGVEVKGQDAAEQVWLEAGSGEVLNRISRHHSALHRTIYSPQYDPANPDLFVQRREGEAPSLLGPVNNLYDFAGQTYNLYASGFGRDSYDGAGKHMISVYLINENCPNAYWNGASTNYCPGFDLDDVVSHEWSHAYTEYTHGLIYSYQSGALNESYSDIFGEAVDLLNGVDGIGGANNAEPWPNGQRWVVGEDLTDVAVTLLLRDMWDPERLGYPAKVSSENYYCRTGDGGGVHYNSGVPNHAFAMLVDGKSFNGETVRGIGMTKATAIYFRAASVYQTPSTNFLGHADAVEASCQDLIGQPLTQLSTTSSGATVSGELIDASDCAQVQAAMRATEMRSPPTQCNFQPQLQPNPPAVCSGGALAFGEDWETGMDGWTLENAGLTPDFPDFNWSVRGELPAGRTGSSAFALNSRGGTCTPGGDHSGRYAITSPVLTAGAGSTEVRFNHYVETELLYDGGNLRISVNGGAFSVVPLTAYTFNAPTRTLDDAPPVGQNTNPKAGENAWTGADGGDTRGSWGTTVLNLRSLVQPGDTYRLQFDFGIDGCNGVTGWFVDEVEAYSCPAAGAPPSASFTGPSSATIVQEVTFDGSASMDNDSVGDGIVGYAWDFGDGFTGSGASAAHRYLLAGAYTVTLTVTDGEGQTASASRSIRVKNPLLPLADLAVSSLTVGTDKGTTPLTAVVVNYGTLASLPSTTRFSVDGAPLGSVNTPSIPGGGSVVVSLPWTFEGLKGSHRLEASADSGNLNPELSEDNNGLSRLVRVTGQRVK